MEGIASDHGQGFAHHAEQLHKAVDLFARVPKFPDGVTDYDINSILRQGRSYATVTGAAQVSL